jgi:hypothetical protein
MLAEKGEKETFSYLKGLVKLDKIAQKKSK